MWLHVLALAGILFAAAVVITPSGMLVGDEGAPLIQAELLRQGRGWTVEHAFPELDPTGENFFLTRFSDGGPVTFAPYGKHPLYPLLLVPLTGALGSFGAMLLSGVGTVVAALAGARLAGLLRPGTERLTFWVVGLFSPLFLDGNIVIAHSLGAACCGWATVSVILSEGHRGWRRFALVATAAALLAGAVLLRTEAVLFAAALAAVLGIRGLWRRSAASTLSAVAIVVAVAATSVVERLWYASFMGAVAGVPNTGATSGGLSGVVAGRMEATMWTLVAPSGRLAGPLAAVAAMVAVLVIIAGLRLRSTPPAWSDARLLLTVATGAAMAGIVASPDAINGLLVAFPFFTFGLVQLRRADVGSDTASLMAWTSGTFALAVLATTYSFGGAVEWGGRFLAIGLPVAIPLVVQPFVRTIDAAPRVPAARHVGRLVLVISLAFSLIAVRALASSHRDIGEMVEAYRLILVSEEIRESGPNLGDGDRRPIVLAEAALGRYAWEHFDEARGMIVDPENLASVLDSFDERGADTVVLLSVQPGEDRAVVEGEGWVATDVPLSSGWAFLILHQDGGDAEVSRTSD